MTISKLNKFIVAALVGVLACGALLLAGCAGGGASSSSASASKSASSSSSSKSTSASSSSSASYTSSVEAGDKYGSGTHHATVTVEGYDPFTIELNADAAPVSVSNFCKLASEGYYDGKTFYRIQQDFCMQGGTKGNSASGQDSSLTPILGEFASNGVDNPLAANFKKGTVAMARTNAVNSATSTFFITLGTEYASALNDQYAAFGTIDDAGMAIVDKIVTDYLPAANQANMGVITDEAKQAKIASIKVTD